MQTKKVCPQTHLFVYLIHIPFTIYKGTTYKNRASSIENFAYLWDLLNAKNMYQRKQNIKRRLPQSGVIAVFHYINYTKKVLRIFAISLPT
jgi:hypothetical protein